MPLPLSKQELLEKLEQAYTKLDLEFDVVTPEYEHLLNIEGGVSCCDIVAYQVGWGKLLLSWEHAEKLGETPDMPATGYKWNELKALAASFYEEYKDCTLEQMREEFSLLYQQLFLWLDSLKDDELLLPQQRLWTGEKWPIVKWVQVNTIAPYQSARTKVRRWKREQSLMT